MGLRLAVLRTSRHIARFGAVAELAGREQCSRKRPAQTSRDLASPNRSIWRRTQKAHKHRAPPDTWTMENVDRLEEAKMARPGLAWLGVRHAAFERLGPAMGSTTNVCLCNRTVKPSANRMVKPSAKRNRSAVQTSSNPSPSASKQCGASKLVLKTAHRSNRLNVGWRDKIYPYIPGTDSQ